MRGRSNFASCLEQSSAVFSMKDVSTKGSSRPGTQVGPMKRGSFGSPPERQTRLRVPNLPVRGNGRNAQSVRADSTASKGTKDANLPHLLNIEKKLMEKKEFVERKTSELEGAIEDYMDLVKIGDTQNLLKVAEILRERKKRDKDNYVNFLNPVSLRKFRENSERGTIFLSRLGKRKLWKGDKFVISRKVKIAESYEELISC